MKAFINNSIKRLHDLNVKHFINIYKRKFKNDNAYLFIKYSFFKLINSS